MSKRWEVDVAHLSYQKDDKTTVSIETKSLLDVILESMGDALVDITHPVFCEPPEWTYKVRWAEPDEDGWTEASLGYVLHSIGQYVGGGFNAYRRARKVASIPVSFEWVRKHYPDAGWPWDGSDHDDEDEDES